MTLQIVGLVTVIIYLLIVVNLLRQKKFVLKYSLLWLFAGIFMLIVAVFPQTLDFFSILLGFQVASNGFFVLCISLLLILMISLTVAISDFSRRIKRLTQKLAMLEERVRELEAKESYRFGSDNSCPNRMEKKDQ